MAEQPLIDTLDAQGGKAVVAGTIRAVNIYNAPSSSSQGVRHELPRDIGDELMTFLAQFPSALPESVVADALKSMTDKPLGAIVAGADASGLRVDNGGYHVADEDVHRWSPATSVHLNAMMRGAAAGFAEYIGEFGRTPAVLDVQHDNIMFAVRWCSEHGLHHEVIRFLEYEKHLKWRGRKTPLYELGTLVIAAADALPSPTPKYAMEAKARALICTRAWIYQRTNQLVQALADGTKAKKIDDHHYFRRGMAFDRKCLGNLHRIKGEFEAAIALLLEAIAMFSDEPVTYAIEVGDCKALLARVYLDRRRGPDDVQAARQLAQEAYDILVNHRDTKDFADCNILLGDLNIGNPQLARDYYEAAQELRPEENIERGDEPYAVAAMRLGELLESRSPSEALGFFETAKQQYERLEELESAACAEWHSLGIRISGSADRRDQLDLQRLEASSRKRRYLVKVRVWELHEAARSVPRSDRIASRPKATDAKYWKPRLDSAEPWADDRIGKLW